MAGLPAVRNVPLGDLGLGTTNLGNLSTYSVLLAGIPVNDLPLVAGQTDNLAGWCASVADVGLDCTTDFGANLADPNAIQNDNITLPVLSFAGVDVDGSALLSLDVSGIDLAGSPIGDTLLDNLNIGVVPLSSQPLVPSPSLPSYLPPTVSVPAELEDVTLGSLGVAAPLAALNPADVSIADTLLSALELGASPTETPLSDYQWASPSIGGATLLSDTTVPPAVAGIEVADLGLNAPLLSVPLDELVLPGSGRSIGSYTLADLVPATSPFGVVAVRCVAVWCQSVRCQSVRCVAVRCQSVWCQSVRCVAKRA